MITLRRARERHRTLVRKQEVWHTFDLERRVGAGGGFGALEVLDEGRLGPGAAILRDRHRAAEIVTYVREGSLAHEDSTGRSGVVLAGEFQRMTAGPAIRHREMNPSRTYGAHVFQLWFRSSEPGLEAEQEQKRFSAGERRGGLCLVTSPDGRRGSLRIHQDAFVYSALLEGGQHVVHELARRRSAWLHVVDGGVTLGELVLTSGDGAAIVTERAVSLSAVQATEILLVDVGEP
jgi:quercetin 2,3-dioxygenase